MASATKELKLCVVGSGPAGVYCAQQVEKKVEKATAGAGDPNKVVVKTDVIDRRPAPGGLARYGVAPDHAPSVSAVLDTVDAFLHRRQTTRFFGNVQVQLPLTSPSIDRDRNDHNDRSIADLFFLFSSPRRQVKTKDVGDVSLDDLRRRYDAVVLANGADRPNELGIQNERELTGRGVFSARQVVAAYCGDPMERLDYSSRVGAFPGPAAEGARDVVVVGAGNVALDVARMLLTPPDALERDTEASRSFLDLVQSPNGPLSKVERVHLVARRGPRSAAFAPRELREILQKRSDQIEAVVTAPERPTSGEGGARFADPFADVPGFKPASRAQKRVFKLLRDHHGGGSEVAKGGRRQLIFHFLHRPVGFEVGEGGELLGLRAAPMAERDDGNGGVVPVPLPGGPGEILVPCQIAIVAASQATIALDGLPSGSESLEGRGGSAVALEREPGKAPVYMCGWANRGARGIIGASMVDADEVSGALVAEYLGGGCERRPSSGEDLAEALRERGVDYVDADGWRRIRAEEERRGRSAGRGGAEKIASAEEMVAIARASP